MAWRPHQTSGFIGSLPSALTSKVSAFIEFLEAEIQATCEAIFLPGLHALINITQSYVFISFRLKSSH